MRRHALDPISLVFGTIFAGLGLIFLFGTVDLAALPPAWSWPIPLMIVGALIILLAVRSDRAYTPGRPDQDVVAVQLPGAAEPIEQVEGTAFAADEPPSPSAGPDAMPGDGTIDQLTDPDLAGDDAR